MIWRFGAWASEWMEIIKSDEKMMEITGLVATWDMLSLRCQSSHLILTTFCYFWQLSPLNLSVMFNSLQTHGLYSSWNSPSQNTGASSVSLFQGSFSTQGSNPGLPHCRRILYQLSHQGSPRTLQWVAYPFFSRPSQPRNRTGVSGIPGRFFTNWATREHTHNYHSFLGLTYGGWSCQARKMSC